MGEHTPTPWEWCGCGKCGYIHAKSADRDVAVALLAPPCGGSNNAEDVYWCAPAYPTTERNANAEFIVRAVNCHDDLVKALEGIVTHARDSTRNGTAAAAATLDDIISFASDAIAAARTPAQQKEPQA